MSENSRIVQTLISATAAVAFLTLVHHPAFADGWDPLSDGFSQSYLSGTPQPASNFNNGRASKNFTNDPNTHQYGDKKENYYILSDEKNYGPDADFPRARTLFNFKF